jgi:hypothetical protein
VAAVPLLSLQATEVTLYLVLLHLLEVVLVVLQRPAQGLQAKMAALAAALTTTSLLLPEMGQQDKALVVVTLVMVLQTTPVVVVAGHQQVAGVTQEVRLLVMAATELLLPSLVRL